MYVTHICSTYMYLQSWPLAGGSASSPAQKRLFRGSYCPVIEVLQQSGS